MGASAAQYRCQDTECGLCRCQQWPHRPSRQEPLRTQRQTCRPCGRRLPGPTSPWGPSKQISQHVCTGERPPQPRARPLHFGPDGVWFGLSVLYSSVRACWCCYPHPILTQPLPASPTPTCTWYLPACRQSRAPAPQVRGPLGAQAQPAELTSSLHGSPVAALTQFRPRFCDLKPQRFLLSQFWKPEVRDQGVGRAGSLWGLREQLSWAFLEVLSTPEHMSPGSLPPRHRAFSVSGLPLPRTPDTA